MQKYFYKIISVPGEIRKKPKLGRVVIPESVEYKRFFWTKPKIGKLFVYDSIENAVKNYQSYNFPRMNKGKIRYYYIYKCIVKNPIKARYMCDIDKLDKIPEFWKNREKKISNKHLNTPVHKGTYYVDAIKIKGCPVNVEFYKC